MSYGGLRIQIKSFSSSNIKSVPQIEKCYYKTLGIEKEANQHEVRQAYLKLAKEWHPDKVPGDEALQYFTHVSKAYETLHDDHQRAIYDDDSISDEDFFTIKIGPFSINLFLVFCTTMGFSAAFFINKKFGIIGKKDEKDACPIDHKNRQEMVSMAKK